MKDYKNEYNVTGQFMKDSDMVNQSEKHTAVQDFKDWLGIGAARRDREWQAQQAQKQMDFQTNSINVQHEKNLEAIKYAHDLSMEASNTAVQRHMADLKEAGINPLMAASGGATAPTATAIGVSSASGAAGGGSSAGIGKLIDGLINVATTAIIAGRKK